VARDGPVHKRICQIEGPKLQTDDLVWLEGKNLKTQYPSAKLAPKRYGPFKIDKEIGLGSYQLELPKHMKIHPVFHASLLTPYKETDAHGPNFRRPPPDIIERKEEFEVQEICGVRRFGKRKQWQYLVKWKGYPDSENTWEPMTNLRRSVKTGLRGLNSGALEVTPEGENVRIVGRNRNLEGLGRKLGRDRRSRRMGAGSWKAGMEWTWPKLVR
jgi:hypothetical protein